MPLCDLQLLATLAYSAQFQFPLTQAEILGRLISGIFLVELNGDNKRDTHKMGRAHQFYLHSTVKSSATTASLSEYARLKAQRSNLLSARLDWLRQLNLVIHQSGWFGVNLQDEQLNQVNKWNSWRKARSQQSAVMRRKAESLIRLAIACNWIRAIGVTGSAAVDGALDHDDLDLVVVTQPRRLWLTRTVLLFFSIFSGKKKLKLHYWLSSHKRSKSKVQPHQNLSNEWCFNLWLDDQHLEVPPDKHSLYTAYEVIQTQWLVDKDIIGRKFLDENQWLDSFLDLDQFKFKSRQEELLLAESRKKRKLLDWLGWPIKIGLNWLDWLLSWLAAFYLNSKTSIPPENLTTQQAFMHDRSSFNSYLARWHLLYLNLFWRYLPANLHLYLKNAHNKQVPLGLITGVFDLLHQGHLFFLEKAKEAIERLNGYLIIGVESDVRVKQVKGEDRPVETAGQRVARLISLNLAEAVFVLPEQFDQPAHHQQLLELIKPAVLYVSRDSPHLQEKKKLLSNCHSRVEVVCPRDKRYSTTKKIQQLQVEPNLG